MISDRYIAPAIRKDSRCFFIAPPTQAVLIIGPLIGSNGRLTTF